MDHVSLSPQAATGVGQETKFKYHYVEIAWKKFGPMKYFMSALKSYLSHWLPFESCSLDFMAAKLCVEIGAFNTILACSKQEFLLFWTIIFKN